MLKQNEHVLILGASGFVGKNIVEELKNHFVITTSIKKASESKEGVIWFDLTEKESWSEIKKLDPTVIINCMGYGVVKTQTDIDKIYEINYRKTVSFFEYLSHQLPATKLIHIGTAFEYDLSIKKLNETSLKLPLTHYGISKMMASAYLFNKKIANPFTVLRPFNMFGLYENESKIIPYLILSQKNKKSIDLSSGLQRRDYCYVSDFAKFILTLLKKPDFNQIPKSINVGTGKSYSIKELAIKLTPLLPNFDDSLWNWDKIPQRKGEHGEFYNDSSLAKELGFKYESIETNLLQTVQYYWNT